MVQPTLQRREGGCCGFGGLRTVFLGDDDPAPAGRASDCRSAFRSIPADAKYDAPWSGLTARVRWRWGSMARPPWAEPSSTQRAPILAAGVERSGRSDASGGSAEAPASSVPISASSRGSTGGAPHRLVAQPLFHRCDEAIQGTDRPQIPVHGRLTRRQRAQDRVQVEPFMDGPSGGAQALGDVFGGNVLS